MLSLSLSLSLMFPSSALLRPNHLTVKLTGYRRIPALSIQKNAIHLASSSNRAAITISDMHKPSSVAFNQSSVFGQTIHLGRSLGFRQSPELGLLSIFFVISVAVGAIFSLVVISIPTMNAFRILAASMDKLSKVVSEEVPGTLSSLKLSGLEINDLTQQLSNLRQNISGNQYGKEGERSKPRFN